jgi:hypothetical protein
MVEELKAWVVVNEDGVLIEAYADERSAVVEASDRAALDFPHDWVVKELVEKKPAEKIVMTEAAYNELIMLNKIKPRLNVYGALSKLLDTHDYLNLRKHASAFSNSQQSRFADLWAKLETTDIDKLVKVILPPKYIVISKATGAKYYIQVDENSIVPAYTRSEDEATKFDSFEEAKLWENPKMKATSTVQKKKAGK